MTLSATLGGLASFREQTDCGQLIQTHGGLGEYIGTPKELCFILSNVEVGQAAIDGYTHDLSLTNLRFPTESPGLIAFTVPWGGTTARVRLIPRRNYLERIRQLTKTRGIVPTTTLRVQAADLGSDAVTGFITDLCLALSIVQGRKN